MFGLRCAMHSRFAFVSLAGAGLVQTSVHALSLPFSKLSGKDQASDNTFDFQNVDNVTNSASIYTTELTVAGQKFLVLLDSGSSDLWLDTSGVDVSGFTNTGIQSSITYLDTTAASGPVLIGNVTIGDFSTNQAFISAPGSNATTYNDKGLLGVGPPLLSQIKQDLKGTSTNGNPFLQNVFDSDPSLKQFISFSLSRSEATGTTGGGVFTVGEIASNLTEVSNSPDLDVISKDRWTVLMDGIVVNGRNFSGNSEFLNSDVPGQGPEQTLSTLDTGTGLALIPKVYADTIYGSIPGAFFDDHQGVYSVPCDAKINLTFVFGGVEYPVHPIDTVTAGITDDGSVACFSGFLPVDVSPQSTEDFLLGDSFLRNVYAVFNFGDFISGNNVPTIQILSTTDPDKAYAEFDTLSAQRNQSITGSAANGGSFVNPNSDNHKNAALSLQIAAFNGWLSLSAFGLMFSLIL